MLSSLRAFFLASPTVLFDAGRFPFAACGGYMDSLGGVPIVSEPCDDGEE
jgi:hypothetical protein